MLDTNVVFSAFLWQKKLKPIYDAIRSRKIVPCFSQLTWDELLRALSYKKFEKQLKKIGVTGDEIIKLLSSRSYFTFSHLNINVIMDDPSDNQLLACALMAKASFIISGDKHLLHLKEFRGIPILPPKGFLKILEL